MTFALLWAAAASVAHAADALDARVAMRVRNVPLQSFLDIISRQTGINFLVSDRVPEDERITAYLDGVTAREALDMLRIKGLTYYEMRGRANYIIEPR